LIIIKIFLISSLTPEASTFTSFKLFYVGTFL